MYPGSIGWGFVSGYSDRTTAIMPRVEPLSRVPVIAIVIALPSLAPAQEAVNFRFVDITEFAGIDFTHVTGASGEKYMVETMGAGAVFFDYDGDLDPALSLARALRLIGRTQLTGGSGLSSQSSDPFRRRIWRMRARLTAWLRWTRRNPWRRKRGKSVARGRTSFSGC